MGENRTNFNRKGTKFYEYEEKILLLEELIKDLKDQREAEINAYFKRNF